MRVFLICLAAVAASGFALGYWSKAARPQSETTTHTPGPTSSAVVSEEIVAATDHPDLRAQFAAADDPASFRDLIESVARGSLQRVERDEWLHAIVARWIEVAGADAVRKMDSHKFWDDIEFYQEIRGLREFALHRLASTDIEAALGTRKGHVGWDSAALSKLVLERHPERLGDFLKTRKFAGWAADWHQAGAELAQQGGVGREALESWFRADIAHQRQFTENLFAGYAAQLAAVDVAAASAWADSLEKLGKGANSASAAARQAIAAHMVESDFATAKQTAIDSGDPFLVETVGVKLAGDDIHAAIDWLQERNDGSPSSNRLYGKILLPVLEKMPQEDVLRLLEQKPEIGLGSYWVQALDRETMPQLTTQIEAMPPSSARDGMLKSAIRRWAENDPEPAMAKARELIAAGQVPLLASMLVGPLANNPEYLFEFASSLPAEDQAKFFDILGRQVGLQDPGGTADAIAAEVDHPLAAQATGMLVARWAQNGLRAPSRWLAELPEGNVRDAGAIALVGQLAPHDAAAALAWAGSIGQGEERIEAMRTSLQSWMKFDPAGAAKAVADLEVSDAERARLMEEVSP